MDILISEERAGTKGSNVYTMPIEHLAKGVYTINVQTGNTTNTITFIKQ